MKIITDTSALYSPEQGKEIGIEVLPLSVTINNKTYVEFVDIFPEEFTELVKAGGIPSSSQPPVGLTMEVLDEYKHDDVLVLNMADGLSGTYQSTLGAKNSIDDHEKIHVINTTTLCGPHRYLVNKALKLQKDGLSIDEVIKELYKSIASTKSFLIPSDFDFLKRGGRLTPLAAKLGGMLKIVPVMITTEDGKRLEKFSMKRTLKASVAEIIKYYEEMGVNEDYNLYIAHASAQEKAEDIKGMLANAFPHVEIETLELSPAFITQGGPGCVAIQTIRK